MATVQAVREKNKTVCWSSIFPAQQVTEQQSALFVKKLLAVAVSSITYLRTIFPEHAFGDRCLEDLNLKILKDDSACPGACQVIQWIKGCFDALDKRYLRMIIIGIYGDAGDPDTVIESYTFKFSYMDKEVSVFRNGNKIASAHTEKDTKKATIRLLRTIILLSQTLTSLPDDVMMTMKLLYYDEVTPPDYEPPGFKETPTDFFSFVDEPLNIKVGDVSTPFHMVKLRIKTDCQQFDMKEDSIEENDTNDTGSTNLEPVNSNSPDVAHHERGQAGIQFVQSPLTKDLEKGQTLKEINKENEKGVENMDCDQVPKVTDQRGKDAEEEIKVKCPCGSDEDGHSGKCTDSSLVNLETIALQATCLWRRTLLACSELNRILPSTLARQLQIEMSIAQGLVKRLEKEGFIRSTLKGKRLGKVIIKKKLQSEGFQKYFGGGYDKRATYVDRSEETIQNGKDTQDGVEKITQTCSKMDLTGRLQLSENKIKNAQVKPRSSKRAISLKDEATEFEISDSQEQGCEDLPLSKRRKASVARSPILV